MKVNFEIDNGSEYWFINRKDFKNLQVQKLKPPIEVGYANQSKTLLSEASVIRFKLAQYLNAVFTHTFIINTDLTDNPILGRDFLIKNRVEINSNQKI